MDVLRTELPYFDPTRDVLQRDVVEHQLAVRPGQFVAGIPDDQLLTVNTHHLCLLLPQEVLFLRVLIGLKFVVIEDFIGLEPFHHGFFLLRDGCESFSSGTSTALHHLLRQSVEIYRVQGQAQEAQQLGPDLAGLQRSWSLGIFG